VRGRALRFLVSRAQPLEQDVPRSQLQQLLLCGLQLQQHVLPVVLWRSLLLHCEEVQRRARAQLLAYHVAVYGSYQADDCCIIHCLQGWYKRQGG
jgi:hypothetical protein